MKQHPTIFPALRRSAALLAALLAFTASGLFAARADAPAATATPLPSPTPDRCEDGYSYAQLVSDVETGLAAYGALVSWDVAGVSVEGRNLYCITLGMGDGYVMVTAGVHAREVANTPMLMQALFTLLDAAKNGEAVDGIDVSDLLSRMTLVLMPLVNPDGYELCRTRASRTKKTNANDVDLNRNFPSRYWNYAGAACAGNRFPGAAPASEPETQAVMAVMARYPYLALMDMHSRGRLVYCGKAELTDADIKNGIPLAEMQRRSHALGNAMLSAMRYKLVAEDALERGGEGTLTDYAFESGIPTVTLETMSNPVSIPQSPFCIAYEYGLIHIPCALLLLADTAAGFSRDVPVRIPVPLLRDAATPFSRFAARAWLHP